MTELKTLKDINLNYEDIWDLKLGSPEEILRQEAIKWVKSVYSYNPETKEWKLAFGGLNTGDFMKFHNITEEDLK